MFNKLIVNSYKIAGFVILCGILLGLASYVIMTGFYYVSSSWVAPVIVSPSDHRVLELNAQLASQQSMKDALVAQKTEMETKQRDAQRVVDAELAYQNAMRASLKADLEDRKVTAYKLATLRKDVAAAGTEIAAANQDFAGLSKERIREMFDARLATKDDVLRGNMELAGLANANLGLAERKVTLDEQVSAAQRQVDSLALVDSLLHPGMNPPAPAKVAFGSGDARGVAPTHEVLLVQREFELSVLSMRRAQEESTAIQQGIDAANATLKRYDSLLASIKDSPYLQAIDKHITIAFVPYTNVDGAKRGTPVYACKGNIVWCKKAGRVGETLEGEVVGSHPLQKMDLRGVMVRIELDDIRAAEEPVLHLGHAPFLL